MTDDDVDVTENWLAAYFHAANRYPEAGFFGGRIQTRWEEPPPAWLAMNADWLTSTPALDWGSEFAELTKTSRSFVIGANMAVRRAVFTAGHRFREDLGCIGSDLDDSAQHGGQEGEWQQRVLAAGTCGVYVPESLVYHRERKYRATRRFVRWYYRNMGVEIRRREGIPAGPALLDAPRYLWRRFMMEGTRYYWLRLAGSPRRWLKADCDLARTRGEIQECRRIARERVKNGAARSHTGYVAESSTSHRHP
jgi:GT2 family glycosyltransferase